MIIAVNYIYNQTKDSIIQKGLEVLDLPEYEYEDVENSIEIENELIDKINKLLKRSYGYYSVKVTKFEEHY